MLGDAASVVPSEDRALAFERIEAMRHFLARLEQELPQIIAEALLESARVTGADVAAILEVQPHELRFVCSTDPTLLDIAVDWPDEQRELGERGSSELRQVARVADALCAQFTGGESHWVLLLGERTGRLDRDAFETKSDTIVEVMTLLLRYRAAHLERRTLVDHLTGLPDRFSTMQRLHETVVASRRNDIRCALLFVDLNGFKGVNDTFGHAHGDNVLRSIGNTMREALRANEFVGRIGGDEFAVVLPMVRTYDEATAAANRLSEGVRSLNIVHGDGAVSVSIGIAFYPEHAANEDEWLHHADLAMYQAKRQRQPYCVYVPGAAASDVPAMSVDIEEAYDREFLLCFQPIFDVESGEVVAAEALLRSLHPRSGVQSAFTTMEAARARRSLEHLDAWVTRRALSYASEWRNQGVKRIHVNIGVASDAILNGVLRAIDASGGDTSMLAVELEWKRFEDELEEYRSFAEAAERCGIAVGLDGFGERPLDLPLLESLPVHFVKPSKALLPSGGATGRSMEALVSVAGAYGWDVVATRVATADDRAAIRTARVQYMQGFAVAQPMTAIDFEQWIESSPRIALVS